MRPVAPFLLGLLCVLTTAAQAGDFVSGDAHFQPNFTVTTGSRNLPPEMGDQSVTIHIEEPGDWRLEVRRDQWNDGIAVQVLMTDDHTNTTREVGIHDIEVTTGAGETMIHVTYKLCFPEGLPPEGNHHTSITYTVTSL